MNKAFLFVFCLIAFGHSVNGMNMRPIIGILDKPCSGDAPYFEPYGNSYFTADYVKWLESGGARVVPIPHNLPPQELLNLFNSINGFLFTGGGLSLEPDTQYYQTASFLFNLALQANQKGDYFPVWGTCMGFQLLSILIANDSNVLCENCFDSYNLPLPLDFTPSAAKSRLYGNAPQDILKNFASENITINLHHDGVTPSTYQNNPKLAAFVDLLSTNVDRKGNIFGSSFEGKKVPVYATQYHPERNSYDWDLPELVSHTFDAVRAMQYLSNFFISEARKNNHKFPTPTAEYNALIYNWNPIYTANFTNVESYPEDQTYVFPW